MWDKITIFATLLYKMAKKPILVVLKSRENNKKQKNKWQKSKKMKQQKKMLL